MNYNTWINIIENEISAFLKMILNMDPIEYNILANLKKYRYMSSLYNIRISYFGEIFRKDRFFGCSIQIITSIYKIQDIKTMYKLYEEPVWKTILSQSKYILKKKFSRTKFVFSCPIKRYLSVKRQIKYQIESVIESEKKF